jgi:hypothetical protein
MNEQILKALTLAEKWLYNPDDALGFTKITKEDLVPVEYWHAATHTIDPNGDVQEVKMDNPLNLISVGNFATCYRTLSRLGFTPYRVKEPKRYTFEQALSEDGQYKADNDGWILTVESGCFNFSYSGVEQVWTNRNRFKEFYTRLPE